MNAFQRSWEITKLSFDVMMKDKELLLFPIIGGIFSLLFLIAMVVPFVLDGFVPDSISGLLFWILIFILYFGLAFIATFFNVCTVYTIKSRFDGKNATFWESIKFAFSKIHLVVAWAIVSAVVGLILRILEDIAEQLGGIGEIIMKVIISLIGVAWSLLTAFVIPVMIYKNIGPMTAIKESAHTFKKTWGESLIRYYGLGFVQVGLIILGIVLTAIAVVLTINVPVLPLVFIAIGIIYILAVVTFFSVANTVFNTALYVYATTGKAPKGYKEDVLKHAFEKKKVK
jgi:hypothetical protein